MTTGETERTRPTSLPATVGAHPAVTSRLTALAAGLPLLVGVDFDGTLAPLVDDPLAARPLPGSMDLLHALAALPGVTVALVSGRELAVLGQLSSAGSPLLLIGSHGAETSWKGGDGLDVEASRRLVALEVGLRRIEQTHPGIRLERKPTALALHTRGLPGDLAADAVQAGAALASRHPGVHLTPGKDVLELAVTEAGKGPALLALAAHLGAASVAYLGDDVTDERAFVHLAEHAVPGRLQTCTVKVGAGDSVADLRVRDEVAAVALLGTLLGTLLEALSAR